MAERGDDDFMRGSLKTIGTAAALFVGLMIFYLCSLTIVCLFDSPFLEEHLNGSVQLLEAEGDYPEFYYADEGAKLDNYTDRLMLENTLISHKEQPFIAALWMKGYTRYWHGYMIFLKPVCIFLNILQLRKTLMMIHGILFFITSLLLYEKAGGLAAVSFFLTWMEYFSMTVAGSLQYFWAYTVMFLGIIVVLATRIHENRRHCILLFGIIGSVINFLDLLTFPLATLTLPLLILMLRWIFEKGESQTEVFKKSVMCSFSWAAGYALTWVAKWLAGTVFLPENTFFVVWNQAQFRMFGDELYPIHRLEVLKRNISHPLLLKHLPVLLILLAAGIVWNLRKKNSAKEVKKIWSLIPVCVFPYIWYEFFCGHSVIHHFFTYRAQMGTSFGMYFIILYLWMGGPKKVHR